MLSKLQNKLRLLSDHIKYLTEIEYKRRGSSLGESCIDSQMFRLTDLKFNL